MIQDIVFQQIYSKKIDAYVQNIAHNAFSNGRQQGWSDILLILNEYEGKGITPTSENIVESLQALLAGQKIVEPDNNNDEKTITKPSLSIVK